MGAFRFQLRMLSAALLAATALGASNHVQAQTLPPGSLLQVSGGNTPGAFQDYTFTYTPTQTGNNYLLFAFRNDPGYWTFGNVTVSAAGSATNLLSNPALATGGATQGVSLPTSWGYATQTGVVPNAGGTWMPPGSAVPSSGSGLGVNTSTAGSWYDGAVGSFDALYQGLFLNSGVTYTVSFSAESDGAAAAPTIELGAFAGVCASLTGSAASCNPASSGFVTAIPPVVPTPIDTTQPFFLASALSFNVLPVFEGGTLRMDQPGATYAQNFTLDGSLTNTIDEFGNNSTFSGVFSDAVAGTPGNIVFADSVGGGSATLTGANTYTGTTTIDAGATLIMGAGGSITNASTLTNSGTLQVDAGGAVTVAEIANNATGTITNFGAVAAALNNAGIVNNEVAAPAVAADAKALAAAAGDGVWIGDVLSNTGTIFNSGTWTGDVASNAGGIFNSGSWNAANFANSAGGTVTNTGILTTTASFTNAGLFQTSGSLTAPLIGNTGTFDNFGAVTGAVNNAGLIDNGAAPSLKAGQIPASAINVAVAAAAIGVWTGDVVSNTGAIINSGTWNAANIFNNIGGTFTTTGVVTATTAFNNAGAFNAAGTLTTPLINNVGAFTVTGILGGEIGHINNAGSLLVDEGGVLIAGGITNNPGGVITNNGAVTDTLDNFGVVINNGTYTADVNNFATGSITNNGVWVGDLLSNTGSIANNGTWRAANFTNNAGGVVTTSGTLTATTAINNAGVFNASGTVTTPLINNSGVFNATNGPVGGAIGTFNNSGVLNLVNFQATDIFTATTYNGQGGQFAVDVNPSASPSTQRSDILKVTNLSGSTTILINPIGAAGLLSAPIPVIEATNVAPGTSVTIGNPPGIISYSLEKSGGTFNLVSTINTSAVSATPAGIGAVVTALNTGFFQNASAFVSEPPDPGKNQWNGGPWIRIAQGQNDIDSQTSAQNPTGTGIEPSKVRATFNGFQTGVDLGVANVAGFGWNTHLGVTAGEVNIRTNDLLTTTIGSQTQVPFLGVYGAVTGHNFFADAEVREDFYLMGVSNPAALLNSASLYGVSLAANGSVGYRLNLPSSWFIEPSAAFIYSDLHENSLRMNLDASGSSYGTLVFNPFLSALGRAGVRVGTTYVFDSIGLALQPFATGSLWHEFEGDIQTTFELPATAVPVSITRVGTFGQIGAGLSAQVLKTGLIGYLRGDYRVGPNISGYAVVAGLRYQF